MPWVRHLFVLGASPTTEVLIGDAPSQRRRVGRGDWLAMASKRGSVRPTRCKSVPIRCPDTVGHENTANPGGHKHLLLCRLFV
jgi:hypothetical protein